MEMRTGSESRYGWFRLSATVAAAWAIVWVPYAAYSGRDEPLAAYWVEFVLIGILLGLGRQGVDVLLIRISAFAAMVIATGAVAQQHSDHATLCGSFAECARVSAIGVIGTGLFVGITAIITLPVAWACNRRAPGLFPQLGWGRLRPRTWWQLLLIFACGVSMIVALEFLLAVPWAQ